MAVALVICAAAAQAAPRDYSITPPRVRYSPAGDFAIVTFTIANLGGDASAPSQVRVTEHQSGRLEITEVIPPLAANEEREFAIEIALAGRPDDDVFFDVAAGIDEYELADSDIARNNTQLFRINKAEAPATGSAPPPQASAPESDPTPAYDFFIPVVNLGLTFRDGGIQLNERFYSQRDLLLGAAALGLALFCLWLLSLVFRLIFRRPPRFDKWQAPYALNSWQDPNSQEARRQSWQYHAQKSALDASCGQDQVAVVKRLLDKRGVSLGGWKVKAARSVQYDVYGRVSRTEVLMPRKLVGQLNRLLRRAPGKSSQELGKTIKPLARKLAKQALGPVESQNLMLPIALELRFEASASDARIHFELYQCHNGLWHLIDQWTPELSPMGARVPEQFSFSLNGQLPGESKREFRARLRDDMEGTLASLFYHPEPQNSAGAANRAGARATETVPAKGDRLPFAYAEPTEEDTDKHPA